MKTFIHDKKNTAINIQLFTEEKIIGTFFEEKPKEGDIIMSHAKRETNFLYVYEVKSISKNRDAKISSTCKADPKGAYFEIEVENVTNDERFVNFDNLVRSNLTIV